MSAALILACLWLITANVVAMLPSRDDLVSGLIRHGHRHARAVHGEEDLARLVREQARPGDVVVCLGAGNISAWAHGLPARLRGEAA